MRRRDVGSRVAERGRVVAATLMALGWLACDSREPDGPAASNLATQPPSFVLLSIDTLRRDHLPIYGYDRDTSPNLSELSKRGVIFDSAITTHTNTAPAHATMMTGKYPGNHGIRDDKSALREDVQTLAEVLSQQGYGWSSAPAHPGMPTSPSPPNGPRHRSHFPTRR